MKKVVYTFMAIVLSGIILSAQTKFGVGVNGMYLSPTGDFGDLYKSGFGGIASVTYNLTDNIQLGVNAGYASVSFNNDHFNEMLNEFGINEKVDIDSKLSIIPVLLGAKYFFTSSSFKPYAALDLGMHLVSVEASSVTVEGQKFDATAKESKATAGWGIGLGFLAQLAPKINLDVNAKISGDNLEVGSNMSVNSDVYSASQSSKSTVAFFTIAAGLQFEL
ncbi:MAG: hypothetical protein C4539_11235 [Ignavibacteriales bacterium]|nr:MAG: hypothetical protein C4539_11235 [Ignavibacteriales bacterium]